MQLDAATLNPLGATAVGGVERLDGQAGAAQNVESLREAALAFESLFTQMMLQSMRATEFGDDLTGNSGGMYRDMLDQEVAKSISAAGGLGLADMMIEQFQRQAGMSGARAALPLYTDATARSPAGQDAGFESPEAFVQTLAPIIERAAGKLGVDPRFVMAQAALETGWGQSIPADAGGQSSFNLFGIKAQSGQRSVDVMTHEYIGGHRVNLNDSFRAYDSYEQSVEDYVAFLQAQPRYATALANADDGGRYAESLQAAGYATDPAYADKLKRIANGPMMQSWTADSPPSGPQGATLNLPPQAAASGA